MKRWSVTALKVTRNIIVFGSMIVALLIWFFVPKTFSNSAFFHVGNGATGSKIGVLILIPLPLFALIKPKRKEEYHGNDEALIHNMETDTQKSNLISQIVIAIGEAIVVIGLMIFVALL